MTAGTGVTHSEFNAANETTHLYQIWIHPETKGLEPEYEQKAFGSIPDTLILVASPGGRDGSLSLRASADIWCGDLTAGSHVTHDLTHSGAWLQHISGHITVNDTPMSSGDGMALDNEPTLLIEAAENSRFLLFDLAGRDRE